MSVFALDLRDLDKVRERFLLEKVHTVVLKEYLGAGAVGRVFVCDVTLPKTVTF